MLSFQGEDRGRASRGPGGRQEGQDGGGAPADAGRRPAPGQAAHGGHEGHVLRWLDPRPFIDPKVMN